MRSLHIIYSRNVSDYAESQYEASLDYFRRSQRAGTYSRNVSDYAESQYEAALDYFRRNQRAGTYSLGNISETYGVSIDKLIGEMQKAIERIKAVSRDILDALADELSALYPARVCDYYKRCIEILKVL